MNVDVLGDEICHDCGSYIDPAHCPMCCERKYLPVGGSRLRICGWCGFTANAIETIDTRGRT